MGGRVHRSLCHAPAPAMRLPGLLALIVLASAVSLATSAPFKHLKMKKSAKLNLLATLKNQILMKKLSPFAKLGAIATKKLTPWVGATASNVLGLPVAVADLVAALARPPPPRTVVIYIRPQGRVTGRARG